jgi:SAM-dependent methyltransferase
VNLAPERRRGAEHLDDRTVDAVTRERAHRDIVRANTLFGGRRAVMLALRPVFDEIVRDRWVADRPRSAPHPRHFTLLDVGTGLGDIPWRARELARRRGLRLATIGCDCVPSLLATARQKLDAALCGDALALPFADASVDVVICSQLLHHFEPAGALRLIAELDRVARRRVVISDLRRSVVAAGGFWAASIALRFSAITRHDGTTSVLRGFTEGELGGMVLTATGVQPAIRRRLGYRLTASWTPVSSAA